MGTGIGTGNSVLLGADPTRGSWDTIRTTASGDSLLPWGGSSAWDVQSAGLD